MRVTDEMVERAFSRLWLWLDMWKKEGVAPYWHDGDTRLLIRQVLADALSGDLLAAEERGSVEGLRHYDTVTDELLVIIDRLAPKEKP